MPFDVGGVGRFGGGVERAGLAFDPMLRERSNGIDLLRAVLALWVVLAHLTAWALIAQGADSVPMPLAVGMGSLQRLFQAHGELHPAVVGFIVFSGYCIHRAGLRTPGPGALTGYAIRRIFRIAPLYDLGIAAGFIGLAVAGMRSPSLAATLSGTDGSSFARVLAKMLALPALYPGAYRCAYLGNAPLATVMVEIVLYVIYGAAFAGLVWRGQAKIIWLACGALFLASLGLFAHGVTSGFYDWWQNGSVLGFLPYWWLGVAFVNPRFARVAAAKLPLVIASWLVLTAVLMWLPTSPVALGIAEIRKLFFACGVGVLVYAADRTPLFRFGVSALVGRAGYSIYALHAPLTYTLVIYDLNWLAVLAVNLALGIAIHLLLERTLTEFGRGLRSRLVAAGALGNPEAPHRSRKIGEAPS